MKYLLVVVVVFCIADASWIKEEINDELIQKVLDEYRPHDEQQTFDPRFCKDAGLECYKCSECHDHLQFGLCISDGDTSRKCMCKWGWTGPHAQKVAVANVVSAWSVNRVRAANCKTPCHYTHDFWNPDCAGSIGGPQCWEHICKAKHGGYATCVNNTCVPNCNKYTCSQKHGKCVNGVCVPLCKEMECSQKYGHCVEGRCVQKCDKCDCIKNHGTCIDGKCVPDCNQSECSKIYGTCIKGNCVKNCIENQCAATGGKCVAGVCVSQYKSDTYSF